MKKILPLVLLFGLIACGQNESNEKLSNNPLSLANNGLIDFNKIEAAHIDLAFDRLKKEAQGQIQEITSIESENRSFQNTMQALDAIVANYMNLAAPLQLLAYTSPDSLIREKSLSTYNEIEKLRNDLSVNEELYNSVLEYSQQLEASDLDNHEKRFLNHTLDYFRKNGFELDDSDRSKLKQITDELTELGSQFSKNIAKDEGFVIVTDEQIEGLSAGYKAARLQDDGNYKIDLSHPSIWPFLKYSNSTEARKKLYLKYVNRAAPENLEVLQNILIKRKEKALLLGFESYAAYAINDRMAQTPQKVWSFEKELGSDLRQFVKKEYEKLYAQKVELGLVGDKVQPWEINYLENILLKNEYNLDEEIVKEYFELDNVLNGLFNLSTILFDLEIEEISSPSTWHEEVRMFKVSEQNQPIGYFYLDLHSRPSKFNHAACFPVRTGRKTREGSELSQAALVCNFPRTNEEKPALLPHKQVVTLFHEFGHLLHHLLSTNELAGQSGFRVAFDFIEAPSQMIEQFAWDYDVLKNFAWHYETEEILPEHLFDKLILAKKSGTALHTNRQIFVGVYDLYLHDNYDPLGSETTTDVLRRLTEEMRMVPYVEGNNFQAAFGHLNGYGASYYGYLWSKVYAMDMFSVFRENGMMNPEIGKKFKKEILQKGSTTGELEMVKNFLGREPNNEAFLEEIGLN